MLPASVFRWQANERDLSNMRSLQRAGMLNKSCDITFQCCRHEAVKSIPVKSTQFRSGADQSQKDKTFCIVCADARACICRHVLTITSQCWPWIARQAAKLCAYSSMQRGQMDCLRDVANVRQGWSCPEMMPWCLVIVFCFT